MPRAASAFTSRIKAAAKWQADDAAAKQAAAEAAQQRKVAARDKAQQLAWKIREDAWSALQATAKVLGGTCGRGGDALELRGIDRPVRISIRAGENADVYLAVEWGRHEALRRCTDAVSARKWLESHIEASVRNVPIVVRRKGDA